MKTIILTIFLSIFTVLSYSQEVKLKTSTQTQESLTKTATKTTYTYKGIPVYKSSKGTYFIVRKSKKSGNYYKVYVEVKS